MKNVDQILGKNIRILARVVAEICHDSTLVEACPIALTRNQFTTLKTLATEQGAEAIGIPCAGGRADACAIESSRGSCSRSDKTVSLSGSGSV